MERIRWSLEEKEAVIKESFAIRQSDVFSSDITCVRLAMQKVLPPHRQRMLVSMQNVDFIHLGWQRLKEREAEQRLAMEDAQLAKEIVSRQTKAASPAPSAYPQVIQSAKCKDDFAKAEPAKAMTLESLTTETLAQELVRRLLEATNQDLIRKIVREEVNATLERRLPGILPPEEEEVHAKHNPEPQVEERPKKPKVCVIGLMNGQTKLIQSEYPHLDFHFLEGNEGHARIKNTMNMMDMTIRTVWCKGQIPQGLRYQHAKGLDTLRSLLNRFPK